MKTKTIANHEVTLEAGKRFIATRPMASRTRTTFPITIADTDGNVAARIDGLNFDEANEFLTAFNNGKMSFNGRIF